MQENLVKEIIGEELFNARKNYRDQIQLAQREYQVFLSKLIDFVNDSISKNKKEVPISISNRLEIAKFRRLIKKISNNLGYKVKSCKKRYVIVENTKFVIEVKKTEN
jgi:hypothetical protein